jgi:hypothetical protein
LIQPTAVVVHGSDPSKDAADSFVGIDVGTAIVDTVPNDITGTKGHSLVQKDIEGYAIAGTDEVHRLTTALGVRQGSEIGFVRRRNAGVGTARANGLTADRSALPRDVHALLILQGIEHEGTLRLNRWE